MIKWERSRGMQKCRNDKMREKNQVIKKNWW
jgi:hypothetical protein